MGRLKIEHSSDSCSTNTHRDAFSNSLHFHVLKVAGREVYIGQGYLSPQATHCRDSSTSNSSETQAARRRPDLASWLPCPQNPPNATSHCTGGRSVAFPQWSCGARFHTLQFLCMIEAMSWTHRGGTPMANTELSTMESQLTSIKSSSQSQRHSNPTCTSIGDNSVAQGQRLSQ
jgi:hypothetical protein